MNILILGAGLMQKPAILSAKELGYKVCVIDADEKAVCVSLSDEFKKIDLKAREEILVYAEELKNKGGLAAVFTAGTDFSASVSYVCEKLGLSAHSFEAALNASIKTRMRSCFEKENVPSPKFISINNCDFNSEAVQKSGLSYPLVIKPVDNMGARGCRMIRNSEEVETAVKAAIRASRTGNAILEDYIDGPEYSIDALVCNGTFTVTGFAERHIFYPPYFIEVGHTMPAVVDKKTHDELISVFALGAKALGLTCGAAKADIKYTKNGPVIGEIAGRLSGGYMSGWTFPYSSGLNLTKQALLIASGKEPAELFSRRIPVEFNPGELCKNAALPYELFEVESTRTSAERAWLSIPGTVEYIEEIKDYTDQAVRDVLPRATVNIGGEVDFPRNNVEKCGNVISVSASRQIAVEAAQDAVSNIMITLKPSNAKTDKFLSGNCESDEDKFPPSAFCMLSEDELSLISGKIQKNQSVASCIPPFILEKYGKLTDWSYNSVVQTAEKFDILRKNHPEIDAKLFWKAFMRGGLQGAVYVSDSEK